MLMPNSAAEQAAIDDAKYNDPYGPVNSLAHVPFASNNIQDRSTTVDPPSVRTKVYPSVTPSRQNNNTNTNNYATLPTYEVEDGSESDSDRPFLPAHSNVPATSQYSTVQPLSGTVQSIDLTNTNNYDSMHSYSAPLHNTYTPKEQKSSSTPHPASIPSLSYTLHTTSATPTNSKSTTVNQPSIDFNTTSHFYATEKKTQDSATGKTGRFKIKGARKQPTPLHATEEQKSSTSSTSLSYPLNDNNDHPMDPVNTPSNNSYTTSNPTKNRLIVFKDTNIVSTDANIDLDLNTMTGTTIIPQAELVISADKTINTYGAPLILMNQTKASENRNVYHYGWPEKDLSSIIQKLFTDRLSLMALDQNYTQLLQKASHHPSKIEAMLQPLYGAAKTYAISGEAISELEEVFRDKFHLKRDDKSPVKFKIHKLGNNSHIHKDVINVFINRSKSFNYYDVIKILKDTYGPGILLFNYYEPTETRLRLMAASMLMQAEEHRRRQEDKSIDRLISDVAENFADLGLEKTDLLTPNSLP
jgi:hypothetical protein